MSDVKLSPQTDTSSRAIFLYRAFAGVVLCQFLIIVVVGIYQLDFWQLYFFRDSYQLADNCKHAATWSSTEEYPVELKTTDHVSLKVPHPLFDPLAETPEHLKKEYKHAHYICEIEVKEADLKKGVQMIHFGWIFGKKTRVFVDAQPWLEFEGDDKPILTRSESDLLRGKTTVEIEVSAPASARMGLRGAAPFVVSGGVTQNSKVMGVEVSLQLLRPMMRLMPVLTLCLILIIAWNIGVTNRILLTALVYFGFVSSRNFHYYLVDFWPWDISATYTIGSAWSIAIRMGFLAFCMELFRVLPNYLEPIKKLAIFVTMGLLALNGYFVYFKYEFSSLQEFYRVLSNSIAAMTVVFSVFGYSRERTQVYSPVDRMLKQVFLVLVGLLSISHYIDSWLIANGYSVSIANQLDLVTPFYVASILFYQLAGIQKKYEEEKSIRTRIQADLSLAREIQDSLALPDLKAEFGGFEISCFQKKHSEVAGDWMAVRGLNEEGAVVVVADVTGKGVQAALVVHAIQSLWADALGDETFDPEKWIRKVNFTLFRLGEKKKHSATIGVLLVQREEIHYWSLGHPPVFYIKNQGVQSELESKVGALQGRGPIIGLEPKIEFSKASLPVHKDESLTLLLATDGILLNGTRTKPREAKEVLQAFLSDGQKALEGFDQNDDKTAVLVVKKV